MFYFLANMTFKDRLRSLGFETYAAYLESQHWANFKAKYKSSKRPMRCSVCSCPKIQLHHHTYRNIGNESLDDVTPLCRVHHKEVHKLLAEAKLFVESSNVIIDQIIEARQEQTANVKLPPRKETRKESRRKRQKRTAARRWQRGNCGPYTGKKKAEKKPKVIVTKCSVKAVTENKDVESRTALKDNLKIDMEAQATRLKDILGRRLFDKTRLRVRK